MSGLTQPAASPRQGDSAKPAATPSIARWTVLCATAEMVGMGAAAAAATTSQRLVGQPETASQVTVAFSLVMAGGLVEGTALGVAQATGLSAWLPRVRRLRWVLVTVIVAGLGWTGASAPAVLAADDGEQPAALLILTGAIGLGLVMGAVLGAAQGSVLRGRVLYPWRWVVANMLGWAVAMPVIFAGATTPGANWSAPAVVALGAVTGLVAGVALGLVTGAFLPLLTRSSRRGRHGFGR